MIRSFLLRHGLKRLPDVAAQDSDKAVKYFAMLARLVRGDVNLTTTAFTEGWAVLFPAVATKSGFDVAWLISVLAKAAQGNPTLTTSIITKGFSILPAIAAGKDFDADERFFEPILRALAAVAQDNPINASTVITEGLAICPALATPNRAYGNIHICDPDAFFFGHFLNLLTKVVRGSDAGLAHTFVTGGVAILPTLAAKSLRATSSFVNALEEVTQDNSALAPAVVTGGLTILPAIAKRSGYDASNLVAKLARVARGNPALTATVITEGLAAFSATTSIYIFDVLAEAAQGNPTLTTPIITAGLAVLPSYLEKGGTGSATCFIPMLMKAAQGNPALTAAVITEGLAILPVIAARSISTASELVVMLAEAAQGNPALTSTVITEGTAILPALVSSFSPRLPIRSLYGDAFNLITALTEAAGVDTAQGFLCREFMISAPGGKDRDQTFIAFGTTPSQTMTRTGRFKETLVGLRVAVEGRYREVSCDIGHYEQVLATAFRAIAHPDDLPSFAQSAPSFASALAPS